MTEMDFNFAGIFVADRIGPSRGSPSFLERRIPAVRATECIQGAPAAGNAGNSPQEGAARFRS